MNGLVLEFMKYSNILGFRGVVFYGSEELALKAICENRDFLFGKRGVPSHKERRWTFPDGSEITFDVLKEDDADHFRYGGANLQFIGIAKGTPVSGYRAIYLKSRLRSLKEDNFPLVFLSEDNPEWNWETRTGNGYAPTEKR